MKFDMIITIRLNVWGYFSVFFYLLSRARWFFNSWRDNLGISL